MLEASFGWGWLSGSGITRPWPRIVFWPPRSNDTGQDDPDHSPKGRHLGKRGNRTLRWAFIEAAHGAVRSGGRWRAMFDRVTNGGRKDRNRGYIKVARELVKVVYVVWSKGIDYQQKGFHE